ncbi:hypothetical protein Tco_0725241 [Tanacetum coccineum]|uniref:Uncharacterized protein n=1 Tax=Tanacetum coccineum TaxID=301880 RepID=A0ABQ4YCC3_9ASTR
MDDPNITMEEYIRLKEEKARRNALSCKPTISPLKYNEIDFRISFDKSDDEDYTISSARDFLGTTPSYTLIRDPMLRLCHRLIAYNIAGRSQAPEKVTVTDLFYLKGMYVGSINIPYLLARYLRLFASGRKREVMISGGQFVACPARHFGLLTEERLRGLTVIIRDLPMIDMAELVRLQICKELDDT